MIGITLRFTVEDRSGVTTKNPEGPLIWAFWHNRLFTVPLVYKKYLPLRKGAVLTSPSKDGQILAEAIGRFGVGSVRGSSSRRGAAGLLGLVDWVKGGHDVAITPDGPRGPCYQLQPGILKLAQKTGAQILPIVVTHQSAFQLKTWDQFQIPRPFSRVDVVLEELQGIGEDAGDDAFEEERRQLETLMLSPAKEEC